MTTKNTSVCKVTSNNLEFMVCLSIDESEDKSAVDPLDYILAAYNEKYRFALQAKVHFDSKEPMDDLLDQIRNAINNGRVVAQFDLITGVLQVATLLKLPNSNNKNLATSPTKYQADLKESKYNKFPIHAILKQIAADERSTTSRWYRYMRGAV